MWLHADSHPLERVSRSHPDGRGRSQAAKHMSLDFKLLLGKFLYIHRARSPDDMSRSRSPGDVTEIKKAGVAVDFLPLTG